MTSLAELSKHRIRIKWFDSTEIIINLIRKEQNENTYFYACSI